MNRTSHPVALPLARISLFVVYFWFGILKIVDSSPAGPMVTGLLDKTLPFFEPHLFLVLFGLYETLIGICFLIPKLNRIAIYLALPHLISVMLPLFLMPSLTWSAPFVPTLEGQYIIKNVLIIALIAHLITSEQRIEKTK